MKWGVIIILTRPSFDYKLKVKVQWWRHPCSQIADIDHKKRNFSEIIDGFL